MDRRVSSSRHVMSSRSPLLACVCVYTVEICNAIQIRWQTSFIAIDISLGSVLFCVAFQSIVEDATKYCHCETTFQLFIPNVQLSLWDVYTLHSWSGDNVPLISSSEWYRLWDWDWMIVRLNFQLKITFDTILIKNPHWHPINCEQFIIFSVFSRRTIWF